jgi:hypothetical protein
MELVKKENMINKDSLLYYFGFWNLDFCNLQPH